MAPANSTDNLAKSVETEDYLRLFNVDNGKSNMIIEYPAGTMFVHWFDC